MQNIPTSFIGYQKEMVNQIIAEKDNRLKTQQEDINYLRSEVSKLEKKVAQTRKRQSK